MKHDLYVYQSHVFFTSCYSTDENFIFYETSERIKIESNDHLIKIKKFFIDKNLFPGRSNAYFCFHIKTGKITALYEENLKRITI